MPRRKGIQKLPADQSNGDASPVADPPRGEAERVLLTVADAAKALAVTPARVRVLLQRGELEGCGSGRDRRVFADSVAAYDPTKVRPRRPRRPREPVWYDMEYAGPFPKPKPVPMTQAEYDCLFSVVESALKAGMLRGEDESDE